jgi:hypothetical protein
MKTFASAAPADELPPEERDALCRTLHAKADAAPPAEPPTNEWGDARLGWYIESLSPAQAYAILVDGASPPEPPAAEGSDARTGWYVARNAHALLLGDYVPAAQVRARPRERTTRASRQRSGTSAAGRDGPGRSRSSDDDEPHDHRLADVAAGGRA